VFALVSSLTICFAHRYRQAPDREMMARRAIQLPPFMKVQARSGKS
jgi:hypothetical protein